MARALKKISWTQVAWITAIGFAWTKLGVGTAVKETGILNMLPGEPPPKSEVGYMSQAEWQAKYGGSYLDYQDWLRGV